MNLRLAVSKMAVAIFTFVSTTTIFALPNLTPYQPAGWSDKIVVARATGTTTDSTGLTTSDTLYVSWAVVNFGDAATGVSFQISLYIDGVFKTSWTSPSLNSSTYTHANDYSIGSLSAGSHTLTITADSGGVVTESNEGDNSYTKTISVGTPNLPNLTPYQPAGWGDKVVVAKTTGATSNSASLLPTDSLYVSWAVVNNGILNATNSFNTSLYVDGVLKNTWSAASLNTNSYVSVNDYSIGSLGAGTHTVCITTDTGGTVSESNEGDNSYTNTITISGPSLPNLTPYQPGGWSDKIVVAKTTGTTTDSANLTTTNTLYVSWSVINNSTSAISSSFSISLYIDGTLKNSWSSSSLGAGFYTYVNDYSIGALGPGSHTITITADSGSAIAESNEADNSYSKIITVTGFPNLAPYQPAGWADKLVIGRATGATNDSTGLTTADTLYANWAVANTGTASATNSFSTCLYVDGVLKNSWSTGSLNTNSYISAADYSLGSLGAGSHTITVTADATNTIAESNESDNSYAKIITVSVPTFPAATLIAPTNAITTSATPAFNWLSVPGAASYRIMIVSNPADLPTDPAANTGGASVITNTTTSSTNFTVSIPLNAGATYYWQVSARSNSQPGTWSSVNSFTVPLVNGLTIVPSFDTTITSDPQAATIEATINSAIAAYECKLADPVTVTVKFQKMGSGLGQSSSYVTSLSYANYRSDLISHATTTNDTIAIAHLSNTSTNPVNGNTSMTLKLPLARALGVTVNPPAGQPDGTISLNTSIMNLSAGQTNPANYSLYATVSHEIDEVLGFSSALNGLNNGDPAPAGAIEPEDLFRYDQSGARSFNTTSNTTAYFSIDGVHALAQFNQHQGGDFQDWSSFSGGQTPQVQDAYGTPGAFPVLGVELTVLDVIGYTYITAPVTITASAGANGSINPSGSFTKNVGDNLSFLASPNANYVVNQWLVDGNVMQAGGTSFSLSGIQTNHTVLVTFTSVQNQTITFAALTNRTLGEPSFGVSATASSGLPVSFSIFSGPASISGTNVTLTGTGTVTVRASQSGNVSYNPAPNVDRSFTVYSKPSVNFAISGLITWSTNVPGYTLETTTNLGAAWTAVSPAPPVVNGQYTFTNTPGAVPRFYRLKK